MPTRARPSTRTRRAARLRGAGDLLLAVATLAAPALGFAAGPASAQALRGGVSSADEAPAIRAAVDRPAQGAAEPVRAGSSRAESLRVPAREETRARVREEVYAPVASPVAAPVVAGSSLSDPAPSARRPAPPEDDPYAPLGLRLGAFTLFSSIAQSVGWDTNPQRVRAPGEAEAFSRTQGEARLESDWSRHGFSVALRGGYDAYARSSDASRPTFSGETALRLDVAQDTRLTFGAAIDLDTERSGARDLPGATVNRPTVLDYAARAALDQTFGRTQLGLRGTIGRSVYGEARRADGSRVSQRDRDLTRFEAAARAGYEIAPGLSPFVEIAADRRAYDRRVDSAGFRRSSDGLTGRVGASFEITRLVTGEASLGWQTRRFDDPGLRRLDGIVGDAALEWALSPLTRVRVFGSSRLDETTRAGASGDRAQTIGLSFSHDLRRHFTARGEIAFTRTRFGGGGSERGVSGGVGLDYAFNRHAVLGADWRRESLRDDAGGGFDADLYLVGLRFRH